MTSLVPMSAEHFECFRKDLISSYAHDNVTALRWVEDSALNRSEAEFNRLLSEDLTTPEHYLYEIRSDPDGPTVGSLWFMFSPTHPDPAAYLYNIRVFPDFRGRGHARAAMLLFERAAIELGASTVGLHVFGFNTTAQALYRSLGYGITGFQMIKRPLPSGV